jgi:glycosyltransferase involved in cell wall biosynthesis
VLSGGAGVAVAPGDFEAMGAAVAALLADPERRRAQAEAGRLAVLARYSPAAHIAQLLPMFAQALA